MAVGYQAARGTAAYNNQGGTYLGYQAGYSAGTGSDYNTLLGYQAGYGITTGKNNIWVGTATSSTAIANLTTGSQNILIGSNISLPSATASGQLNIQNIIFGTGNTATGANVSTGNVGIGTTTPWQTLSVVGGVAFNGLTAAASGNLTVCINSTSKLLYLGGSATTCEPSSQRYKNTITDSTTGLDELMALRPVTFYFNDDISGEEHIGFIAEEVYGIDPRLVQLNQEGLPDALRLGEFLPLIVKSIQELNFNLETIASSTASSTPESQSLVTRFFGNLFSRITTWFADATNGITKFFAREVHTGTLCVKKSDDTEVCVTGDELGALLSGQEAVSVSGGNESGGSSVPIPEPEPTSTTTPGITPEPEPSTPDDSVGIPIESVGAESALAPENLPPADISASE